MNAFGTVIGNVYDRVKYALYGSTMGLGGGATQYPVCAVTWHSKLNDIDSGDISHSMVAEGGTAGGSFVNHQYLNWDEYGAMIIADITIAAAGKYRWENGDIEVEVDA